MPDWSKIAPARAGRIVHDLKLLANTARRDYDVDPAAARAMLSEIDSAVAALKDAYAPRLAAGTGEPAAPAPAAHSPAAAQDGADPRLACPDGSELRLYPVLEPRRVARFVHEIPARDLPLWIERLTARICDEAHERAS